MYISLNNLLTYQKVIDEVTATSEDILRGLEMFWMQCLPNDVNGTNKVLLHYRILK